MGNAPTAREAVISEALRVLREYCGCEADERDVLLFGAEHPVSSPLPLKIGVDNFQSRVYNMSKDSEKFESWLFGGVRLEGGYAEFDLKGSGMMLLFELFEAEHTEAGTPADRIALGTNAGCVHARLLHTCETAAGGFYLPSEKNAKRALWLCMMARSSSQWSLALEAAALAMNEHRINGTLCARVARAMAAAVFDRFYQ